MLTEPTMQKLKKLRLDAFAAAWLEQEKNPRLVSLSFDERLGLLVDAEWMHRENKRLDRALKDAKLKLCERSPRNAEFGTSRRET